MERQVGEAYSYTFPAIRGVQAGREYYVSMCPLEIMPRLFNCPEGEIPPELRAQRSLNKARIPALSKYIVANPKTYVFSSLTASIDGKVHFEPAGEGQLGSRLGVLSVPMSARILINDGQHRRAAIERALDASPALKYETISVVFFVDAGLARSQQMFADLNRYAVRPTKSIGILYDHRDPVAKLAHQVANDVDVFRDMTEKAKSTISNRSRKLFTLSSIYQATKRLLSKKDGEPVTETDRALATRFWNEVSTLIPDWKAAAEREVAPSELRSDFVHAHGIALQAIAIAGAALIARYEVDWAKRLSPIKKVDWSRRNAKLWEGRALIGGRLNKAENNVLLTANVLKKCLGLPLSPNEERLEKEYGKARRESRS
jgi:DNA sulfur modification protein DndB